MTIAASAPEGETYDFTAIQKKWLPIWDEIKPFRSGDPTDSRPKKYVLDMFPYPSGDLHMGHAEAYALGDIISRYWVQQGYNVMHPIGWDAFGLPAENAAIKRGLDPRQWTYENIEQQRSSMRRYACSFDWDRVIRTCDEEYYRWNQWIFLQMFKHGLAYRKDSWVNWCPKDQTVLANEQVVGGLCERCDTPVTKKKLTQWYLRITDYADRLLDDLSSLEGKWPQKVITMQRNWIGRSTGADVDFSIEGREEPVTVYTTRPDTLYGATFMVVAPDTDLAAELVADADPDTRHRFEAYLDEVKAKNEISRTSNEHEKTGVFLGRWATNPVNGERLPIWAADYVLSDHGHGAIMAVPAHDQRDLDFAKKFDLPVRVVVSSDEPDPAESGVAVTGEGVLKNSGPLDGLTKEQALPKAIDVLQQRGTGRAAKNFRLRDWLISRQRYWGTPIPIIHCEKCGLVPVPDDQLPVRLPSHEGLDLQPKGSSPLGAAEDWVNVTCPKCGGRARRDADTMDTFVDSSWYYMRFVSPHDDKAPFDKAEAAKWLPVDQYVGGVTHAILHLLYARFFTKVLHDLGFVDFDEPFSRLLNQGMVLMDGSAMSKSRGNLVRLSDELNDVGVDAVRLTMAFAGPPEDDIDWADVSPGGSAKFLARAWRIAQETSSAVGADPRDGALELHKATHRCLADVEEAVESFRFNVAVAKLMELVNAARKAIDNPQIGPDDAAVREAAEAIAIVLSLFAPYTAEDMWQLLGHEPSVARAGFPEIDESLLTAATITAVVQVNGKLRARLEVAADIGADALEQAALANSRIQECLTDVTLRKTIVRAPKLVNFVVS